MIGALSGDILGSVYEGAGIKDKVFRLFRDRDRPTDDSILSLAVAKAILDANGRPELEAYARALRELGRRYPDAGYGGGFRRWLAKDGEGPYHSWGNGSAMRASPVGWAFDGEDEVVRQAGLSASPTHDHAEGIKGAQAVALAVYLARTGATKDDIRGKIEDRFGYDLHRTVDSIRPGYAFDVSCQGSVPESIVAFLDSADFEDAIRNAISLGGDADTMACIAGAIAEAFYGGVTPRVLAWVLPRIDDPMLDILSRFAGRWMPGAPAVAVGREIAARKPQRGATGAIQARGKPRSRAQGRDRGTRSTERSGPRYKIVMDFDTDRRVRDYARRLAAEPGLGGKRLRESLARLDIARPDAAWTLTALLNTKRPCIFAESQVKGDGSDWSAEELGILGDISVAVQVTVFDDGLHQAPHTHPEPFPGTLLFVPGALLASSGGEPADWNIVNDGEIDQSRYEALYERRLLPVLRYASSAAIASGRKAFVTVPGLGCGQFAGVFRGRLGGRLRDALEAILVRYADSLSGIRAVWYDPYDECENERHELGHISFLVRPFRKNHPGIPLLCPPSAYAEGGDDFSGCDLYSVVAWDHVSWPGNDYWAGSRATDDGVKAAATDSMFALSGFRGSYDTAANAYLPPEGVRSWEDLVLEHGLCLQAIDNTLVVKSG